jgi:H+/Cl- antiporter ClcA
MTGGAFGSMIAQLSIDGAEEETLLVAGAGGMSATFASPVAAVLLAVSSCSSVEPRSLIPVAQPGAVAAVARRYLGFGPSFPYPSTRSS